MSRPHRTAAPADFSTSFLDLCCCALGGLILIMVLLVPTPMPGRAGDAPPVERTVDVSLSLPVLADPASPLPTAVDEQHDTDYLLSVRSANVKIVLGGVTVFDNLIAPDQVYLPGLPPGHFVREDSRLGRVTVTVLRDVADPSWLNNEVHSGTPRPKSRLVAQLGLRLPENPADDIWPLLVEVYATVTTPTRELPADFEKLWTTVMEQYEMFKMNPPAVGTTVSHAVAGGFPWASVVVGPEGEAVRAQIELVPIRFLSRDKPIFVGIGFARPELLAMYDANFSARMMSVFPSPQWGSFSVPEGPRFWVFHTDQSPIGTVRGHAEFGLKWTGSVQLQEDPEGDSSIPVLELSESLTHLTITPDP